MLLRGIKLFGCDREVSRAPALCAPASCNDLCAVGALDMSFLRFAHFFDSPKEQAFVSAM